MYNWEINYILFIKVENPEEILCNKLTHEINNSCASRYYLEKTKTSKKDESTESGKISISKSKNKVNETNAENETSRLEELKRQLKVEEEKNKPSPQKKKKLFK